MKPGYVHANVASHTHSSAAGDFGQGGKKSKDTALSHYHGLLLVNKSTQILAYFGRNSDSDFTLNEFHVKLLLL